MDCTHPVLITVKGDSRFSGQKMWVPCGKCYWCKKERSKAWAVRIMLECLDHEENSFVTLTYDDEHLPELDMSLVPFGQLPFTLWKPDLQNFFKRYRKDLDFKIRYYSVGEYGDHTFRPHYHFIGFGVPYWHEELIKDNWQNGIVDIGDVTMASANYVAGYVQKKLYGDLADETYGFRQFPYSAMSKGIGKNYFLAHAQQLIDDGFIEFKGKKVSIPRYFWKLMEKENLLMKSQLEQLAEQRFEAAQDRLDLEYARRGITDQNVREIFEFRKLEARRHIAEKLERNKRGVL